MSLSQDLKEFNAAFQSSYKMFNDAEAKRALQAYRDKHLELETEKVRGASQADLDEAERIRREGGVPRTSTDTPGGGGGGGGAGGKTGTDFGDNDLTASGNAIRSIESGSPAGNYGAKGKVITKRDGSSDQALGAYQVMRSNVPQWTLKHYGKQLSADEFLSNREAQDAVFKGEFGGYIKKYGPTGAANMWFSGSPNPSSKTDANNTSVRSYGQQFTSLFEKFGGRNKTDVAGTQPKIASVERGDLPPPEGATAAPAPDRPAIPVKTATTDYKPTSYEPGDEQARLEEIIRNPLSPAPMVEDAKAKLAKLKGSPAVAGSGGKQAGYAPTDTNVGGFQTASAEEDDEDQPVNTGFAAAGGAIPDPTGNYGAPRGYTQQPDKVSTPTPTPSGAVVGGAGFTPRRVGQQAPGTTGVSAIPTPAGTGYGLGQVTPGQQALRDRRASQAASAAAAAQAAAAKPAANVAGNQWDPRYGNQPDVPGYDTPWGGHQAGVTTDQLEAMPDSAFANPQAFAAMHPGTQNYVRWRVGEDAWGAGQRQQDQWSRPSQQQSGYARGGLVGHYAEGGPADEPFDPEGTGDQNLKPDDKGAPLTDEMRAARDRIQARVEARRKIFPMGSGRAQADVRDRGPAEGETGGPYRDASVGPYGPTDPEAQAREEARRPTPQPPAITPDGPDTAGPVRQPRVPDTGTLGPSDQDVVAREGARRNPRYDPSLQGGDQPIVQPRMPQPSVGPDDQTMIAREAARRNPRYDPSLQNGDQPVRSLPSYTPPAGRDDAGLPGEGTGGPNYGGGQMPRPPMPDLPTPQDTTLSDEQKRQIDAMQRTPSAGPLAKPAIPTPPDEGGGLTDDQKRKIDAMQRTPTAGAPPKPPGPPGPGFDWARYGEYDRNAVEPRIDMPFRDEPKKPEPERPDRERLPAETTRPIWRSDERTNVNKGQRHGDSEVTAPVARPDERHDPIRDKEVTTGSTKKAPAKKPAPAPAKRKAIPERGDRPVRRAEPQQLLVSDAEIRNNGLNRAQVMELHGARVAAQRQARARGESPQQWGNPAVYPSFSGTRQGQRAGQAIPTRPGPYPSLDESLRRAQMQRGQGRPGLFSFLEEGGAVGGFAKGFKSAFDAGNKQRKRDEFRDRYGDDAGYDDGWDDTKGYAEGGAVDREGDDWHREEGDRYYDDQDHSPMSLSDVEEDQREQEMRTPVVKGRGKSRMPEIKGLYDPDDREEDTHYYAGGGAVDDDDEEDDDDDTEAADDEGLGNATNPLIRDTGAPRLDPAQHLINPDGKVQPAHDAIERGLALKEQQLNEKRPAIGSSPRHDAAQRDYGGGSEVMTNADYNSVARTVDPNGQMKPSDRTVLMYQELQDFWLSKGNPRKAAEASLGLTMYNRRAAQASGGMALAALTSGQDGGPASPDDVKRSAEWLSKAYNYVPNNQSLSFAPNAKDPLSIDYRIVDNGTGKEVAVGTADVGQLSAMAKGVMSGQQFDTEMWRIVNEGRGGARSGTGAAPRPTTFDKKSERNQEVEALRQKALEAKRSGDEDAFKSTIQEIRSKVGTDAGATDYLRRLHLEAGVKPEDLPPELREKGKPESPKAKKDREAADASAARDKEISDLREQAKTDPGAQKKLLETQLAGADDAYDRVKPNPTGRYSDLENAVTDMVKDKANRQAISDAAYAIMVKNRVPPGQAVRAALAIQAAAGSKEGGDIDFDKQGRAILPGFSGTPLYVPGRLFRTFFPQPKPRQPAPAGASTVQAPVATPSNQPPAVPPAQPPTQLGYGD